MTRIQVTTIVPALPPAIDGVGDYALALAKKMRESHAIESEFIAAGIHSNVVKGSCSGFKVTDSSKLDNLATTKSQTQQCLLLHYSGYGYAKRGVALELVRTLERWHNLNPQARLVVVFHELAGTGPITSSAFWLQRFQLSVIRRLLVLASACLVTSEYNRRALVELLPWYSGPIKLQPVFSVVGEAAGITPLMRRADYCVVFGTHGRRKQVYARESARMSRVLDCLQVKRVVDVGAGDCIPKEWCGRVVEKRGPLELDHLAEIISNARCGIIEYRTDLLAKSTIFAGYAAHGTLPIVMRRSAGWLDGISNQDHLVHEDSDDELTIEELERRAVNVKCWYDEHRLSEQSKIFENLIENSVQNISKSRPRVLLVSSQPNQSSAANRYLEDHPRFRFLSIFCSGFDVRLWKGEEFINKSVFSSGLLCGYRHLFLRNWSPIPSLKNFFGLFNPSLVRYVISSDFCVVYGHAYLSMIMAAVLARVLGSKLLLSNDAVDLGLSDSWRRQAKRIILPWLYNRFADGVLVPSSRSRGFLLSLGVKDSRITLTPYVVDNDLIIGRASAVNRSDERQKLGILGDTFLVLYVAKLIERKRPFDLLRAVAKAGRSNIALLMVGDGPLLEELRNEVNKLGIADRVCFYGLAPYSDLPRLYVASDLLVHPAEHEPFGLIVNEAMLCGLPVLVSDKTGAVDDLVREGETGFIFPAGDVDMLADRIDFLSCNRQLTAAVALKAQERISRWSPAENAESLLQTISNFELIQVR